MPNDNEYTPTTDDVRARYIRAEPGYDPPLIPNDPDYEVTGAEFDRWLAVRDAEVAAQAFKRTATAMTPLPFVAIGFDGGTTLALTGDNAGHWVEGSPTHVRVSALSRAFAHLQELRGGDIEQEYLDSVYAEATRLVGVLP